MKEASSYLLVPSDPKLAGLACWWEEYATLEAAEDNQAEYADRGLNYDIMPVLAA
jgi:hypothetical protein